jgi:CheY-like chemotaxis protein
MNDMKRRILIIDDDPDLCQTVQYLLEKNGPYQVRIENNSIKTLETIYQFRPELILLDITMPGVNGYDICQHVKSDKILHFIKIIFVTGNVTKEQRLRGYEVGADDYITKPFENDELLAKVKVFLKLKYTEEMSQIKSNILDALHDKPPGGLKKGRRLTDIFRRKFPPRQDPAGVTGWEELAVGKTANAYDYIKNAMFLNKMMEGITLSKETVEIDGIIQKALRKVRNRAVAKRITFQLREKGIERQGEMDRGLMNKAFSCVLTNVIDHSPKHAQYQIIVNYEHPEYCEIFIEDSGHDFDDKSCDEIFNEFMTFTPQESKRGQGLSIVCAKRIIQLHGGDLTLQTDHEGAYFWVFQVYYTRSNPDINPMFY